MGCASFSLCLLLLVCLSFSPSSFVLFFWFISSSLKLNDLIFNTFEYMEWNIVQYQTLSRNSYTSYGALLDIFLSKHSQPSTTGASSQTVQVVSLECSLATGKEASCEEAEAEGVTYQDGKADGVCRKESAGDDAAVV